MPEHVRLDVDAISQQGAPAGFELVLASAAFRTISDHIPGHELRTMAAALVQHPGPALRPVIDRTFRFDEMVDAHRYLETNGQFGKVVVTV